MLKASSIPTYPIVSVNHVTLLRLDKWHYRLGHSSHYKISIFHSQFPFIDSPKCVDTCTIWPLAKQRKLPYNHSTSKSNCVFELLHMDLWGPIFVVSIHGHRYFLIMVDDFSRHT